jgi:hypothetical protein
LRASLQAARDYLRMRCCNTESTLSILFFVANICFSKRPNCRLMSARVIPKQQQQRRRQHHLLADHLALSLEKGVALLSGLLREIPETTTWAAQVSASVRRSSEQLTHAGLCSSSSSPSADLHHRMSDIL